MLARTSEGARFSEAAQVWVASHTVSVSLAGFAKLTSICDIEHPHHEQEEEDVDRHGSHLLLRHSGEIVRIPHGSVVGGCQRKLPSGEQSAVSDQT